MGPDDAVLYSPLFEIDKAKAELPQTIVAYGGIETDEFKRQSNDFALALTRNGAATKVLCVEERNHFDLIFDLLDETTLLGGEVLNLVQCT